MFNRLSRRVGAPAPQTYLGQPGFVFSEKSGTVPRPRDLILPVGSARWRLPLIEFVRKLVYGRTADRDHRIIGDKGGFGVPPLIGDHNTAPKRIFASALVDLITQEFRYGAVEQFGD